MRKVLASLVCVLFLLPAIGSAANGPDPAQRRNPPRRAVVVVHKNFPVKRPPRNVVVRPLRRPFRVLPARFLPPVVWAGVLVTAAPARNVLIWEDGDTLSQDEEWTELGLNCENTGTRLWLEVVSGRARFDWAEIVFESGDAQVVDMQEWERGPGYYELATFGGARLVDHVRLVARAASPQARVVLRLQK